MNRINHILLGITVFVILSSAVMMTVSAIRTNQGKYPEPSSRPAIEDAAVWDGDLGMYINSEFTKDEKGNYVLKELYDSSISSDDSPEALWMQEHQESENAIDRAIIQSIKEPLPPLLGLRSSLQPREIPTMVEAMKTIPVSDLPELWQRLVNEPAFRAQKILGIELMTGIIIDHGQFDPNSQRLWCQEFTERKNSIPKEIVYSDKERYGALLLPALAEKVKQSGLNEEESRLFLELTDIPLGQKGIVPMDSSIIESERIAKWIMDNTDYLNALQIIIQK